jgi:hypothetical protein
LDPGSRIRDPGSGTGKNQDPGSGINIPDPHYCFPSGKPFLLNFPGGMVLPVGLSQGETRWVPYRIVDLETFTVDIEEEFNRCK